MKEEEVHLVSSWWPDRRRGPLIMSIMSSYRKRFTQWVHRGLIKEEVQSSIPSCLDGGRGSLIESIIFRCRNRFSQWVHYALKWAHHALKWAHHGLKWAHHLVVHEEVNWVRSIIRDTNRCSRTETIMSRCMTMFNQWVRHVSIMEEVHSVWSACPDEERGSLIELVMSWRG